MVNSPMRRAGRALLVALGLASPIPASADSVEDTEIDATARIEEGLENALTLPRPKQIGLATIFDGNKFVQCRRLSTHDIRCEGGGTPMQPSLSHVLTAARIDRLAALGWRLDPSFGNYARSFASDAAPYAIAEAVMRALKEGYDADPTKVEIATDWVADLPCPPRNGPRMNQAGAISNAKMSSAFTAVKACGYAPPPDLTPIATTGSATELISLYGGRVAGEIKRLRVNWEREVFVIFDPGIGFFQCAPQPAREVYCEAQSADARPALASVLTPERVERLRAAGFADPGHAPNFSKTYAASVSETAIAREALTILHDVYGYTGQAKLEVKTENGNGD